MSLLATPQTLSLGRLCIWQPGPTAPSETFLTLHAKGLPADVTVVHGGRLPMVAGSDRSLLSPLTRLAVMSGRFYSSGVQAAIDRRSNTEITSYLRKMRFKAVLAQFGWSAVEVCTAAHRARVPLIAHFHGIDAYCDSEALRRSRYAQVFQTASAVVAVSRDMLATLERLGCRPDKLFHIPCGADESVIGCADPAQAPPNVLAVGRMVEKKAPHLTVLAFSIVARQHPEAVLHFVGDGPLFNSTFQLAKALSIENRIHFWGAQPQSKVAELIRSSRVFVQHSIRAANGDAEGTPVAIVEALSAGVPVVATRHGGILDVVKDGKTGLLVDEYDVGAMAEKICQLLRDSSLVREMSKAARAHALTHLTSKTRLHELAEAIRTCIK